MSEIPTSTFEDAKRHISGYINKYNYQRPHGSLSQNGRKLTPADKYFGCEKIISKALSEGIKETEELLKENPLAMPRPIYLVENIGGKDILIRGKEVDITIGSIGQAGENLAKSGSRESIEEGHKSWVESENGQISQEFAIVSKTSCAFGGDSKEQAGDTDIRGDEDTRHAYYKWKKSLQALEETLKNLGPGRPPKDRARELGEANRKIKELSKKEEELKRKIEKQKKEMLKIETILQVQREIIKGRIADGLLPADILDKKNTKSLLDSNEE